MSATTSIKCDACEAELRKHTGFHHSYALELDAIDLEIHQSGPVMDLMIYPPLDRAAHFCGFDCLIVWLNKRTDKINAATPITKTVRAMKFGDLKVSEFNEDSVWIGHDDGEGGQFNKKDLADWIAEFYHKHF